MKKKSEIISRIAKNLSCFYPEHQNNFMCPTCLNVFSLDDYSDISEAHIIPKAAGGSTKTYICKPCNSRFGAAQDKWVGEYIRLKQNNLTPMHTNKQKGYFELDGIRVSGEYKVGPDNSLNFYIFRNKSSPISIEKLLAHSEKGLKIASIPIPLFEHQKEINVGFLTAAYLLWFKELGYSWVLQNHLGMVRKQIQFPNDDVIRNKYIGSIRGKPFEKAWIGIANVNDELSLVAGISNKLIFLPVADREDFYDELIGDESTFNYRILQEFKFSNKHYWGGPVGVIYKNRAIVKPDFIFENDMDYRFLLFDGSNKLPYLAGEIPADEFDRQKNLPHAKYLKVAGVMNTSDEIKKPPLPLSKKNKRRK